MPASRAWHTILPGQHELSSSIWCLWIQAWLGAALYDPSADGNAPFCYPCGKPMDLFGWHFLVNCGTGYVHIPRHNNISV